MYNEKLLIDLIQTGCPTYKVGYSHFVNIDISKANLAKPEIYVGHREERLERPQTLWDDGYNGQDQFTVLVTEIQILCSRIKLVEVLTNVKASYFDWSPFPNDHNFSRLVNIEGRVVAANDVNIWWSQFVGLIYPRLN